MVNDLKILFGSKINPQSYVDLPLLKDTYESDINGLYIIGELSGTTLIKLTVNQGIEVAKTIISQLNKKKSADDIYDVIIAGAGCAGLSALRELLKNNKKVICFEKEQTIQTIRNFTKGKNIYLEPLDLSFQSDWNLEEGSKEETVKYFDTLLNKEKLSVNEYEKITDVIKKGNFFTVKTEKSEYKSKFVIIAIGNAGSPRMSGASGEKENSYKIFNTLTDPGLFKEKHILVYGGGDSALECAIALAEENFVTLAYRGSNFSRPKKRNLEKLEELSDDRKISIKLNTKLEAIYKGQASIITEGQEEIKIKNDFIFEMIGTDIPYEFLKKINIKLESQWTPIKWVSLGILSIAVYLLFAWKKGFFPFPYYGFGLENLPPILNAPTFWYSLLYTLIMLIFGISAMKRWNKKGKDTYQTLRYISLIFFQISGFLLIEVILAVFLPGISWRFYGFNNPFPLFFDTFYNYTGITNTAMRWFIIGGAAIISLVIIPLSVRWHGKRFCTWVCGCGGLAETLGDRWRHKTPKGERAEKWEIVGTIILFWAFLSAFVILAFYGGNSKQSGLWHNLYSIIVDFWLIGVIPVAAYPFLGGKVWCRFWCPLAKLMQILSKRYGTLKIVSNEKCINCTKCSRYCQVGVDVMKFAKNQESFDNTNSSCIHCGICISVCPMNVLSFKNEKRK